MKIILSKRFLLLTLIVPFFIFQGVEGYAYTGQVKHSITSPGDYPTGLCFAEGALYMADRKADKIFTIDPKSGKVIRDIPTPAYWPMGLCHDGEYLWSVDAKGGIPLSENFTGVVFKVDPENGNVMHKLGLPCSKPTGLTWDGKYLWVADDGADKIIQIDPNDGTTIKSFRAPASRPMGLTFDGTYLWLSDRASNEIYMISPTTGKVLLITEAPGEHAKGMAWDGKMLWNVDWQSRTIYSLVRQDDDLFRRTNERYSDARFTHLSTNYGPGKVNTLDVHIALGENRDNQDIVGDIKINGKDQSVYTDKWGQKTAHWSMKNIKAGDQREVSIEAKVKTYDVRYFIFPDKVGGLDIIPQDIKDTYLENNEKYQFDHPVIQDAVSKAVGEEKNPYWMARNIYDYLMKNLYYEMSGGWNTAPTVLARGNGSCSEYSFVFIAMCRAAGLPARYVGSFVMIDDRTSMDDEFHRWVEVYLPNYGWIPIDPAGGDSDSPRVQAEKFGHVGNRYFITTQSGGGSESMGWTYNCNHSYTSEPKTYLVVEYFGDWRPLDIK